MSRPHTAESFFGHDKNKNTTARSDDAVVFFCGKVVPNENNHATTAGFFTIFSNIIFYKDFRAKIKEEYL